MKNRIRLINGEELTYIEKGEGKKTIILLHSIFFTSIYFTPLLNKLEKEYKLFAIDLRGFGDSTYYRRIEDITDFSDDLNIFIKLKNIEKPLIIGWGLGGIVALDFSSKFTNIPDKIILLNSLSHQGLPIFKTNEEGKVLIGEKFESANEMEAHLKNTNLVIKSLLEKDYDLFKNAMNEKFKLTNIEEEWYFDSFKQRNAVDLYWAIANFNLSNTHNFYTSGKQSIFRIKAPIMNVIGLEDTAIKNSVAVQNYRALPNQSVLIKYEDSKHQIVLDNVLRLVEDIKKFDNELITVKK